MSFQDNAIYWVEVEKIVPNPYQPRREFDEEKLKELADSIRMYGVLQPLTVTRKEIQRDDGSFHTEYELIAGERRLRASRLGGIEQVPVIIRSGEDTEQEKLELAIIENLQREDLNSVDRALAFQQLAEMFNLSHVEVAKKVGRSREYVSNSIRLLLLPETILSALKRGEISEGHARSLLMLKERPEEQDVVFREILLKKLSVREVERISRKIATDKVRKKNWDGTDPALIELEREFTNAVGTRVQIQKTDYGGKVTIDYFSEDDLNRLLTMVRPNAKGQLELVNEEGNVSDAVSIQRLAAATPLAAVASDVVNETPSEAAPEAERQESVPVPTADAEPSPTPESPVEEAEHIIHKTQAASAAIEEAVINHVEYYNAPTPPRPADVAEPLSDTQQREVQENSPSPVTTSESHTAPQSEPQPPAPAPTEESAAPVPAPVEQPVHQHVEQPSGSTVGEPSEQVTSPAPAAEPSTPKPEVKPETKPEPPDDDESQLYSMRNFSL